MITNKMEQIEQLPDKRQLKKVYSSCFGFFVR